VFPDDKRKIPYLKDFSKKKIRTDSKTAPEQNEPAPERNVSAPGHVFPSEKTFYFKTRCPCTAGHNRSAQFLSYGRYGA